MLTPLSGSTLPFTSKMISGVRKNKQIQYGASGRIATLRLNNILSNFQVNVSYELLYLISGHVAEGRGARVGGGRHAPLFLRPVGKLSMLPEIVGKLSMLSEIVKIFDGGWGGEGEDIE